MQLLKSTPYIMRSFKNNMKFIIAAIIIFAFNPAYAQVSVLESPAVQISILSVILISGVLIYLVRGEIMQNSIFDLNSIGYKLFFYQNMITGEQHISYSLQKLLNLKDYENEISSLLQLCDQKDRLMLTELYETLADSSKAYDDVYIKDIDIAVKLHLNSELYLSCQYLVLKDQTGFTHGFFLFFGNITDEMRTVHNLKKENDLLKQDLGNKNTLLDSLPFPVWLRNENLDVIYYNQKFRDIITYPNLNIKELKRIELDSKSLNFAKLSLQNKQALQEERHVIIDGQRCLYMIQEIPSADKMTGYGHDITSKELIKKELERTISAQADLLESTASASAIYDDHKRLQFFNQSFVKLWKLDEKWLLSHPTYGEILEKLRENRRLPEQADFQKFKKEQINLFSEIMSPYNDFFYLPDGTVLRVIVIQHALGGLLFSYEDMTDKLELERSINTLNAVQKETLDSLSEGVAAFSENGKLELSNPRFLSLWNLDSSFVQIKPHITLLVNKIEQEIEDTPHFKEDILNKVNLRKTDSITVQTKQHLDIRILITPLPDGGLLMSCRDITDTRLVEKTLLEKNHALQTADQIKTEFLANISYELRSPLTSIIGFSEILKRKYHGGLNSQQLEYIDAINSSSYFLTALINDILDLTSIDAGHMQLEKSEFNLCDVADNAIDLIKSKAHNQVMIASNYSAKPILMVADQKRIKQILFKLLSNAADRSNQDEQISLIIHDSSEKITITVTDFGAHLTAEDMKHVFDKFYQPSVQNNNKKIGGELGLALVKSLTNLHGGEIVVESNNKETSFKCIFKKS